MKIFTYPKSLLCADDEFIIAHCDKNQLNQKERMGQLHGERERDTEGGRDRLEFAAWIIRDNERRVSMKGLGIFEMNEIEEWRSVCRIK